MMFQPSDEKWEQKVVESFRRQTFLTLLGAEMTHLRPGECTIRVRRRNDLCQQHGFLHAGVSATIADTAAGYAAFSLMPAEATVLTVEFKLNLLAPADADELCANATVIRQGRTLTPVSCNVIAAKGGAEVQVATFLGTMMCLHGKSDKASTGASAQ